MGHGVTDQAHAPQDQEHPQGCGAAGQQQAAEQGPAHELEFAERLPEMCGEVHQATCAQDCGAISSRLEPNTQPLLFTSRVWGMCWRTAVRSWQTTTRVRP